MKTAILQNHTMIHVFYAFLYCANPTVATTYYKLEKLTDKDLAINLKILFSKRLSA